MDDLVADLSIDMIPDGMYRKIAETIGVESFIKLSELIGGNTFYFPKKESLMRPVRDERIKQAFTGFNHVEIAKRYNVTERWVRALCGEGFAEGQLSFEELLDHASQK